MRRDRSSRIAVVGAGPAGCFVVLEILKKIPDATIDLYDKRPTPYGLVAYGVAPDHCRTRRILKVLDGAITHPKVTFHPDTIIGEAPHAVADLLHTHRAVILCTGAEIPVMLDVPGRDGPGLPIWSGLDFAYWANGHPSPPFPVVDAPKVVVVGHGNVALDAARLLARPPETLRETDIAPQALRQLERMQTKTITLLGRRGPAQSKFGPEELREIAESDYWNVDVREEDLVLTPEELAWQEANPHHPHVFNLETFRSMVGRKIKPGLSTIAFRFHTRVTRIVSPLQITVETGPDQHTAMDYNLLIEAIGHRARPIPGLPFDEARSILPHQAGRVEGSPGVYTSGWLKRGATGLIGHNRKDAIETVSCLFDDWNNGVI